MTIDSVLIAGFAISRVSIKRVEVSRGRKTQWRAGMGIGFVVGAALGAVLGIAASEGIDASDGNGSPGAIAVIFGGIGGGAGALIGSLLGAATHGDRWGLASLSTLRVAPTVHSDGAVGVAFGLRF
jgi:hypothetical protein